MSARVRRGSGFKRFLCFILIDIGAEKPCSHKHFGGYGRRCEMVVSLRPLNTPRAASQKSQINMFSNFIFSEPSTDTPAGFLLILRENQRN
jgi:hypothetical protein